jgi:DNA mismatch repair protein MutS2
MNPLIAEFDRARRTQTLAQDPTHDRCFDLLEWRAVTAQVARRCRTADGAARVRATVPYIDPQPIRLFRDLGRELVPRDDGDPWPPVIDVSCITELLGEGAARRLEGTDLTRIGAAAADLDVLRLHFLNPDEPRTLWLRGARHLPDFTPLKTMITRALDVDGQVRDDASPRLSKLRRDIRKNEASARSAVNRIMETARSKGWTNGPEVTLRGDRFCIPLLSGSKRRVQGLVHDRSSSGNTIFVEPADVVQQQNDIVEMRFDMNAEIERIILDLNRSVQAQAEALLEAAEFMSLVDQCQASVIWSRDLRCNPPQLNVNGDLRVVAARHPLLLEAVGDRDAVMPLHMEINRECNVLVISGPNAGGKSVALKGVGILALIAQSGWDVPAAAGTELPLIKRFCVDLGDDQSIAASLSSFSAHLNHLAEFLKLAGPDTLILSDEIGSGTDPQEGTALAFTILEALADRGSLVVASTHYGLLKAAVADHPRMLNAAMAFDEETLQPLYTLQPGVPGASHAFDIATRMNLPAEIIRKAQTRVGSDRFHIEKLLGDLGRRNREMEAAQQRLAELETSARTRDAQLQTRLDEINIERSRLLDETRREGETFLGEARRKLENVVRELRSSGADAKVIRYGKDTLQAMSESLPEASSGRQSRKPLSEGDKVRIPHLNIEGVVIEVRGNRLVADARGMRLTLDVSDVEPGTAAEASPQPATSTRNSWTDSSGPEQEIDLRGYRAEEGWEALDLLIDRAIPAGYQQISIIHGIGTGRLREYLYQRLKKDPRIQSVQEAGNGQGGAGRSIAYLAD